MVPVRVAYTVRRRSQMAKAAKGKKKEKVKVEVSAEGKAKLKSSIKDLKAERAKALESGDKKALKAVRYKIKRSKLSLKRVVEALAKENATKAKAAESAPAAEAAPAAESAPAEGAAE